MGAEESNLGIGQSLEESIWKGKLRSGVEVNAASRESFCSCFLKMRDIAMCSCADKNGPREKQKCDEASEVNSYMEVYPVHPSSLHPGAEVKDGRKSMPQPKLSQDTGFPQQCGHRSSSRATLISRWIL